MANTRTVGAAGDHGTIADALAWFQTNHDFDTDGMAYLELLDDAEYAETGLDVSGIAGTPSATAYLLIYAVSAVRHAGRYSSTSGARVRGTTNGSHVFSVGLGYTRILGLQIEQASAGGSDEGIRVAADQVGVSRCVVRVANVADQDAIYLAPGADRTLYVDNSVLQAAGLNSRGGVNVQNYTGTNTLTAHLDHVTAIGFGAGGVVGRQNLDKTNVTAVHCHNVISLNSGLNDYGEDGTVSGNGVSSWNGSNNIASDATAENKFTSAFDSVALVDTEPASGENVWVTDATSPYDLSIAGENGFTVTQNGLDRTASEPDSRQDFSTDIIGATRSAFTIGAFEFQSATAVTDTAIITAANATPLSSADVGSASDTASVATATAIPLAGADAGRATDAASVASAAARSLAAQETGRATDQASVSQAQATMVAALDRAIADGKAVVVQAAAAPRQAMDTALADGGAQITQVMAAPLTAVIDTGSVYLTGEIAIRPVLSGAPAVAPAMTGSPRLNPALKGGVGIKPN